MVLWYTLVETIAAAAVGILCVALGLAGRRPSDVSVGGMALIELLLLVQVIIAVVAPLSGNPPLGNVVEFWAYLIAAVVLVPGAVLWALAERSQWSTVVMGIASGAIAVMTWRMQVIWDLPPS